MKKIALLLISLVILSCNKDDDDSIAFNRLVGEWEGTVDLGGPVPYSFYAMVNDNGKLVWEIYLKNAEGKYIERYYWPSLDWQLVSENSNNWLYGKIEATETRIPVFLPPSNTGNAFSEIYGINSPLLWNAHYGVFDFDESFNSFELRNVCVPQNLVLADDTLCAGWENWELTTAFYGKRIK